MLKERCPKGAEPWPQTTAPSGSIESTSPIATRHSIESRAAQQGFEVVVVRVVEGHVDLIALRVVAHAVHQEEVRVLAVRRAVAARGERADRLDREGEVALGRRGLGVAR